MSIAAIALTALVYIVLGVVYILGFDYIKRRKEGLLVGYHLGMSVVRVLVTLGCVVLFAIKTQDKQEILYYAVFCMVAYLVLMIVTLKLRH